MQMDEVQPAVRIVSDYRVRMGELERQAVNLLLGKH